MMESASEVTENVKIGVVEAKEGDLKPAPTTALETSQHMDVEDVPDPDEDDLDDLDDLLDEFSAAKLESNISPKPAEVLGSVNPESSSKATAAAPAAEPQPNLDDEFSEEEFAKQLQAGMAGLLGDLDKSPEMQSQFEEMFKQMSEAVAAEEQRGSGSTPTVGPSTPGAAESSTDPADEGLSFQETIRRTMERMQSSGEQATAAAAAGGEEDFMAEMLKQLSSGDLAADGNDEDFSKMLMGMMEQLTNKEILYEPMKELHDKFPEWLAKNKDSVAAEDLKRYEEQRTIVSEIVAKFDEPTYSDSNAAAREYIVDRMQKMQAAGSPPPDLVGDMASAQDAFNTADEQCNPQ